MNTDRETILPQKRTLASIVSEMLETIDQAGGEVTDALDQLGLVLESKTEAYSVVYKHMHAEAAAFDELAAAYKAKAATREAQAEALRKRLLHEMERLGVDKIKTRTSTASIRESKCVFIADPEAFVKVWCGSKFVRETIVPNKQALKDALEDGVQFAGAELVTNKTVQFR